MKNVDRVGLGSDLVLLFGYGILVGCGLAGLGCLRLFEFVVWYCLFGILCFVVYRLWCLMLYIYIVVIM